jgi:hypothetical protein
MVVDRRGDERISLPSSAVATGSTVPSEEGTNEVSGGPTFWGTIGSTEPIVASSAWTMPRCGARLVTLIAALLVCVCREKGRETNYRSNENENERKMQGVEQESPERGLVKSKGQSLSVKVQSLSILSSHLNQR